MVQSIDYITEISLKIQWVYRIDEDPFLEAIAYHYLAPQIKDLIWNCNIVESDVKYVVKHHNLFCGHVLKAWAKRNCTEPQTENDISSQVLWHNSKIRINGTPVLYLEAWRKGLLYVHQLIKEDGMFYCYKAFCENYGACISWLEYYSLIRALPYVWKTVIRQRGRGILTHNSYYKN